MTDLTTTHAPSLIQQLTAIAETIKQLPTTTITDDTRYPNKQQQEALLRRAVEDALHCAWALEEYNGGVMRGGYLSPQGKAGAK